MQRVQDSDVRFQLENWNKNKIRLWVDQQDTVKGNVLEPMTSSTTSAPLGIMIVSLVGVRLGADRTVSS